MAVLALSALTMSAQEDSTFTFKVGVGLSSFVGSDIEYEDGDTENAFDVCGRFNAGVMAGISYDFGQFTVGAEYSRGFTKAIKDAKFYNQAFGLTFGYKF